MKPDPIGAFFQIWMMIQNPEMIRKELRADWKRRIDRLGLDLKNVSKQEFYENCLVASARAGAT